MEFNLSFKMNDAVYIRDPESTELGKRLIKHSINLIYNLGFEAFTFKKLAAEVGTTEATIYRYFENKHRLLLYILSWYWYYMDFLFDYKLQNVKDSKQKIKTIIHLLTHEPGADESGLNYNKKQLNDIVIAESSKVYLIKEVAEINKNEVFKPLKDLCAKIALVFMEYNNDYKYPYSLSSTLLETAHDQQFFVNNLPRLTDASSTEKNNYVSTYIEDLIFKALA